MCETGQEMADSCRRRDLGALSSILTRGFPVDGTDDNGLAALQICASLGWTEAVSMLLKHGADVNKKCPMGWTALMQAVCSGHLDTTMVLVHAGAELAYTNPFRWDVLSLAVTSQNETLFRSLVALVKPSELSSALVVASQQGKVDTVKFLIAMKVDVNGKLPLTGLTPLMLAASEGQKQVVEILLSSGADPHLTNSSDLRALDIAVMNGQDGIAAILSQRTELRFCLNPSFRHWSCSSPCVQTQFYDYSGNALFPHTPLSHSPGVFSQNSQCFIFPSHPYLNHSISNQNICLSPYLVSPHSPYSLSPHFYYQNPHSPSPIIPPWMYAKNKQDHKPVNKKVSFKSKRHIHNWWKKFMRRCRNKILKKKQIKVLLTFDEHGDSCDTDLEKLLHQLGLDFLTPIMKQHEIDIRTLHLLQEKDFEELGVFDPALRAYVLQRLRGLKLDSYPLN